MRSEEMDWAQYYETQDGRAPRPLLLEALELVGPSDGRRAADLGCGDGRDTLELLARGWQVLAVDPEPEAMTRLRTLVPEAHAPRLVTAQTSFARLALPRVDLAFASFSLPFTAPTDFDLVWRAVATSLVGGGWYAGTFFGPQDTWAQDPTMTIHTRAEVEALVADWDVRVLREVHADGDGGSGPKHWHVHEVVARHTAGTQPNG